MAIITITIPTAKVAKALKGYLKLYPNREMKPNPAFVSAEETPEVEEFLEENLYTDKQWVNEQVKRLFVRDVHRGLNVIAKEEAVLETDNTLIE
jgi:hypothetical protein